MSEIFRVVSLLGENFFFQLPWDNQNFQEFSDLLCMLMLSFWQILQNNLNYASASNIRENIEFYK